MNPRDWQRIISTSVIALISVIFITAAHAYSTYDGCIDCHGDFKGDDYISKQDGTAWGQHLMKGHEKFVECDACHQSDRDGPVFLNSSVDSTLSKSCVGCHGRQEDVNGSCVGGDGEQVECGGGAGLRRMHDLNVSSANCSSCHSGDPVPAGEHVNPFNYGLAGVVMQDACDADGTESYFGSTGLDNDGDGDRDASDSDCQTNTAPTQPGSLSASAVTTNSATVSWGASDDANDDEITYQVDYRRNDYTTWTNGGMTTSISLPLNGLDSNQSYDVRVTPNDGTEDGASITTPNLLATEFDTGSLFEDGFEGN